MKLAFMNMEPTRWEKLYQTELHIARTHCEDTDFHGILCSHALIMIEALQHPHALSGGNIFALGMQLGTVHCNWIALLQSRVSREHSEMLRVISELLKRSAQLLVALITEDRLCTMAQLTKSEELEAIAGMHTRMGRVARGMLKGFGSYVGSLCNLYQTQFDADDGPAGGGIHRIDVAAARYWVLYHAVALGRLLDNLLETGV